VPPGIGNITANVKAIFYDKAFHPSTKDIPEGATFGVLLDRTSFYAESGGQEYDTGNIVIDGVADFEVTNVQVSNGYVVHTGSLKYGQLDVGSEVISSYDEVSIAFSPLYLHVLMLAISSDAGLCETTIPLPIFSTFRFVKSLATTSTRKARLLLPQSCGSISRTKLRSTLPILPRLSQ
jgi:hypothetical protein